MGSWPRQKRLTSALTRPLVSVQLVQPWVAAIKEELAWGLRQGECQVSKVKRLEHVG